MADSNEPPAGTSNTPPAGTSGEGNTPPEATPPAGTPEATPGSEEKTVTLKESDYKNLISQRDKANSSASANEDFVLGLAKERTIDDFLTANKEAYSHVTREDLMYLDDPDALEAEAKRIQRRHEDLIQQSLLDIETAKPPELSPEDKAAELKKIQKNPGKSGFGRMLQLQRRSN